MVKNPDVHVILRTLTPISSQVSAVACLYVYVILTYNLWLNINFSVIRQLEPSYDDDDDVDDDQDLEIVDLRECECIKVLMSVYPQLVRHWRAAGSISKTVHYLMEASAAAISTHDNMKVGDIHQHTITWRSVISINTQ